jgi:hypothetical protein
MSSTEYINMSRHVYRIRTERRQCKSFMSPPANCLVNWSTHILCWAKLLFTRDETAHVRQALIKAITGPIPMEGSEHVGTSKRISVLGLTSSR